MLSTRCEGFGRRVCSWRKERTLFLVTAFPVFTLRRTASQRELTPVIDVAPGKDYVSSTLKACAGMGLKKLGRQLQAISVCLQVHALAQKSGFEFHSYVVNSLIDAYGKCGHVMFKTGKRQYSKPDLLRRKCGQLH
ncbi:uncharacterized protein LOC119987868 isoform X2 [Tripterygium wilfordii]|uniref:uncharacterized protein LOC119987868 isoform X2 n=1 Tax=Tripterygium wilfordii TaxID=458696 RepID=UPI0018F82FAA|nr:uncharacterized protein LOC119987868 isoform X2 [Tripterygium wilfordii]